MSGIKSTKVIFLYVLKILLEQSDPDHPVTTDAIIKQLYDYGYTCDRKAIYRYVESLTEFGFEIEKSTVEPRGYYILSREFEIHELKLLADAVQSSRFITVKKSKELIDKLGKLTSVHEAQSLSRSLHFLGLNKTDNERVFYSLDAVYEAMRTNRRVEFRYFRYLPDGSREYRNNGEMYVVSPYAVVWDDDKYYLHAYHEKYDTISSFRLDMMQDARVSELARLKQKEYASYNPNDREKAAFSQFGGEAITVICEFDNSLAGAVFDHFGREVSISPVGKDRFKASLQVIVSPRFLSWIFGFGDKARILAPQSVVKEYVGMLDCVKNIYK